MSGDDYLSRLTLFVGRTRLEDIPSEVLQRTQQILVDTLPVIAWGMREPQPSALARQQLTGQNECGGAWVIGAGRTGAALDAAMLNGIAGAWLDFDEGNFLANGHPGIQVIPAALAVAQEQHQSGGELLATIALAYEVVARIGMATQTKLIVNPHGTFGVVGSALAVARLKGMPAEQLRGLASLAASCCMATNRHTMLHGATVRNWYAGHSGFMGQMAVRMAAIMPDRIAAAASFHGGWLATEKPDSPHLLLGKVKARLYFGHADNDPLMPREWIDRLEAALRDWHGAFESEVYQGAAHGWTVPGRDGVYNELQAQRAFEKEVELFDATLKA